MDLALSDMHASLDSPTTESMNFLNEIGNVYPDAISFAAGQPFEGFFDLNAVHHYLDAFRAHLTEERGQSEEQVRRTLLQYGSARGVVNDLICRNLETDEGIRVDPRAVVVTSGCQEALFLVLRALRGGPSDVVLAVRPNYSGLDAAARLVEMGVHPVREPASGIDGESLTEAAEQARREGLNPRACYVIPDFANPTGRSLSVAARRSLLESAEKQGILLIEDNPYGIFGPEESGTPTLKSLDASRSVVYLGSFAKSGIPGARVGYVVADQRVSAHESSDTLFADHLAKAKGMLNINTSPITQAVMGGKLIMNGFSLRSANTRERHVYQGNLSRLLQEMSRRFPEGEGHGVSWNTPTGGFFLTLKVPFPASDEALGVCARKHGVLWTPMHHFHGDGIPRNEIRLSFSHLTQDRIALGVERFASFVTDHAGS